jgi:transposase
MDKVVERCAGLDVHKDSVVACVRVPAPSGGRSTRVHTFGATTAELLALRDWLVAERVSVVGMESTGVFWKPVFYLLEDVCEPWLLNARHLRNVPGRKTDVKDAEWIAQLVEHGLVRPSFVPPRPIRELRDLTRYRKAQIQERSREAQRLDKVLQDAGIKLSSVAADVLGKSGRDMLAALIAGQAGPQALADLARGRMRAKIPALREALTGRFNAHHALLVGEILAKLDYLDEAIGRLSEQIEARLAPFARHVELLDTATGIDVRTAQGILAEIGPDMAVFGSAARLASWAGRCPGSHESAGKNTSGKTRKGPKWLGVYLHDAALAACRSKNTYLAAQYARIKYRHGHAKAIGAVEHSLLVAIYHMLDRDQPYHDLGGDYFARRDTLEHRATKLVRQLAALGYQIHVDATPA